jgi:bleomycin hydrolase
VVYFEIFDSVNASYMGRKQKRCRDESDEILDVDVKRHLKESDVKFIKSLNSILLNKSANRIAQKNLYDKAGPGGAQLASEKIHEWAEDAVEKDSTVCKVLSDVPLSYLATDRSLIRKKEVYSYNVSPKISDDPDKKLYPTNQMSSGRCWMFAALNYLKWRMIPAYDLKLDFELSESHLFFYDKIERANILLNELILLSWTGKLDYNDEYLQHIISSNGPMCDGGTWTGFVNLITKYGIIPKEHFGETYNSSSTDELNYVLHRYICKCLSEIKIERNKNTLKTRLQKVWLPEITEIVTKFLGKPTEGFNWEYTTRSGQPVTVEGLTPLTFYSQFVDPVASLDTKVVLIHDPREGGIPLYRPAYTEGLSNGNMSGGSSFVKYAVPIEKMEKLVIESLKGDETVWFAADVMNSYDYQTGMLCHEGFNYSNVLNLDIELDKSTRLETQVGGPTHAMLFVAANVEDDVSTRFRVENSWGYTGNDSGFHLMTRDWFYQNVYMIVVDRKYLDEETESEIERNALKPYLLKYNDPFGNVAPPPVMPPADIQARKSRSASK